MNRIEQFQNELRDYLISMMPVPWKKIFLFAECNRGSATYWFCVLEKETGIVITYESFFSRYDSYQYYKRDINHKLFLLLDDLYQAYVKEYGEDNVWHTIEFIINENGTFRTYLSYEHMNEGILRFRDSFLKKHLNTEYKYIKGKYPSLE